MGLELYNPGTAGPLCRPDHRPFLPATQRFAQISFGCLHGRIFLRERPKVTKSVIIIVRARGIKREPLVSDFDYMSELALVIAQDADAVGYAPTSLLELHPAKWSNSHAKVREAMNVD
jgi:hypothetical protein